MALNLEVVTRVAGAVDATHPLSRVFQALDLAKRVHLTNGTGAGQADRLYRAQITLEAGDHVDIDLAGDIQDPFGRYIDFEQLRVLLAVADAGNAGEVRVGGAASGAVLGPFADADTVLRLTPGGVLALASKAEGAWIIVGGADVLRLANPGDAVAVVDLWVIGGSVPDLDLGIDGNALIALLSEHLQ